MSSATLSREGWRQRFWRTRPLDPPRVELEHARIYILPSRRGIAFGLTLIAMLVAALNYSTSLALFLVFVFAGAMAAGLLHTFRNLAGLSLRQGSAPRGHAGGDLHFVLALEARGGQVRSGIRLRADRHGSTAACPDLPGGQSAAVKVIVPARQRGPLDLGRLTLWTDYPLGLWRAWAYVHFPWQGLVYPHPEDAPPPAPANAGVGDQAGNGPGSEDFAGFRVYQPGDPLPHVAWKQLARGQGWLTKQYRGGGGGDCHLRLAELPSGMDLEAKISRLAAWAIRSENAGRRYALALPESSLPLAHGAAHLERVLSALALHPPLPRSETAGRHES
ncbi:MAG: DUF58 domain-containing protein [Betaproteobacteria bacterium]|nr:DUF58 domain-containing protein [Betaproteobacteria bacterium]